MDHLTHLPILHADDTLLVVDKPAGVLSHPNRPEPEGKKCAFRGEYDPETRRFRSAGDDCWLLHRLDQDTSGALLAARTEAAANDLREQFGDRAVGKHYTALVDGRPNRPTGVWRDHITKRRERGRVRSTVVRKGSANAELRYEMTEAFRRFGLSLLDIRPVTGRTHQIRVQAAERHHPVAGDRIYGNFRRNRDLRRALGLRRMFLHAAGLEFRHPASGKPFAVEAPLPPELEGVLMQARKGGT